MRIEPFAESEKPVLRNLMQAYRHDLSEFTGDDPDEQGLFGLGNYFDAYWVEESRFPLKIMQRDRLVGFALVRRISQDAHSMAEFFILRAYRRSGIGRSAAMHIFDQFPGTWHIAQDKGNEPAQGFWRSVIREYTGNNFEEVWSDAQPSGPKQVFQSRGA